MGVTHQGHVAWVGALIGVFVFLTACVETGRPGETPGSSPQAGSTSLVAGTAGITSSAPGADGGLTCWSSPGQGATGPIEFDDVTESVGLVDPLLGLHGHAAAFGEVNGDDLPDLVVGTFGDRDTEVYQVRGADGPAPDQLLASGPELEPVEGWSTELGRTSGAVFADFDGDGDNDLLLVRHAGIDGSFQTPTRLYQNVDGALQPHSEPLPDGFRGRTPAVADYDGDGLLDLYVTEDKFGETGGLLLHNQGSLDFSDVSNGSGLEGVFALSAASGDINNDSVPDLATSTAIFINRGGLEFEDVTPDEYQAVPIGEEDDPAGVALGDLDKDGLTDIVVGQHYRATVEYDSEIPVRVFLNTGGEVPVFEEATESSGMTPLPTLAPHVHLADIDNDSWLDIVTSASANDGATPAIYRNMGTPDLSFEVTSGLGSDQYWVGAPVADLDRDGRLDVFGLEWEPSLPSIMFRNVGETGHWLEVSISGPGRGVGSLVTVSNQNGDLLGSREIAVGSGYSSGHLPIAHFGLGPETVVDVTIRSPDGSTTDLPGITADQHIRWPNGCSGS